MGNFLIIMNAAEILEEILIHSHSLDIFSDVASLASLYMDQGKSQFESFEIAYLEIIESKGLIDLRC